MVCFSCFVDAAFGKTDTRDDPFTAAALHALPSVLAYIGVALWTFEAPI
jgi:hypothetical protein